METQEKPTNYLENTLFAFLGALTATVMSLGMFGAVDNRAPASFESPSAQVDFDPRVYITE